MTVKIPMGKANASQPTRGLVEARRSAIMRAVLGSGTRPELLVRAIVRRLGYSATFNSRSLPGKPDIVLLTIRKVVFVHGCFWHGHACKRGNRIPHTNRDYWIEKVARNRDRHRSAIRMLRAGGWSTLTLWECQLADLSRASARLATFFAPLPDRHRRAKA